MVFIVLDVIEQWRRLVMVEWPDLVFPPINLWSLWRKDEQMIKFKKLNDNATAPVRGSSTAAGLDLSCTKDFSIDPGARVIIGTGLAFELPWDSVGLIKPRSKLANKHGIHVLGGVVDSDYRGEVKVILINLGGCVVEFKKCDRIAQMVVQKIDLSVPEEATELDSTERGSSGVDCKDLRL